MCVPSWGNYKVCVLSTLPRPHLCDYTRYVVVCSIQYLVNRESVKCEWLTNCPINDIVKGLANHSRLGLNYMSSFIDTIVLILWIVVDLQSWSWLITQFMSIRRFWSENISIGSLSNWVQSIFGRDPLEHSNSNMLWIRSKSSIVAWKRLRVISGKPLWKYRILFRHEMNISIHRIP